MTLRTDSENEFYFNLITYIIAHRTYISCVCYQIIIRSTETASNLSLDVIDVLALSHEVHNDEKDTNNPESLLIKYHVIDQVRIIIECHYGMESSRAGKEDNGIEYYQVDAVGSEVREFINQTI